jgi:hypothetical protein
MPTTAKTETSAVGALRHELLRPFIQRRIAIGCGQQQENCITRFKPHAIDFAWGSNKASGVLYGRVEALNFRQ